MSYDDIAPDAVAPTSRDSPTSLDAEFKCLDTVIALYDFPGTQPSHLPLDLGDTVYVLAKNGSGWWDGVLFNRAGELCRGWFPHNYVRSVNYVQPVLNKLKTNKELDSITAANTAANVLFPLFASLLQKNLNESGRDSPNSNTRKNSVVSFASLDTSVHSDPKPRKSEQKAPEALLKLQEHLLLQNVQHQLSVASAGLAPYSGSYSQGMSPSESSDYVKFTPVEDAEALASEIKKVYGRNVVWLPRMTDTGDLAFYSEELDIFTDTLPLVLMDEAVDLEGGGNLKVPSHDAIEDHSVVTRLQRNDFFDSDSVGPASRSTSSITKGFDKRDSTSSTLSQNSATSYHHFDRPFFATPGLFYNQFTDFTRWTELRDRFDYILQLTYNALKDFNKQLFIMHVSQLTKMVAFVMFSARLAQDDFVGTKYEKQVRRKLKNVSELFSQMYMNGLLHLSMMHHSKGSSTAELFSTGIRELNKSTSSPSTAQQSIASPKLEHPENPAEAPDQLEAEIKEKAKDENTLVTYLQQIDIDTEAVRHNVNGLVRIFLKLSGEKKEANNVSDGSDLSGGEKSDTERYDILPQMYPRFITGEFNGGNWCNPFFGSGYPRLNLSGDQLKNRYHLKVIIDQTALDLATKSTDEIVRYSKDVRVFLAPDKQSRYFNEVLKAERNELVLRIIYKILHHSSSLVDLMESFDFTVFCLIKRYSLNEGKDSLSFDEDKGPTSQHAEDPLAGRDQEGSPGVSSGLDTTTSSNLTFDYPMVLEFFEYKQQLHNWISNVVLHSQALTLDDPDVFTAMNEDDTVIYDRDALKNPLERSSRLLSNILSQQGKLKGAGRICVDQDEYLTELLEDGIEFCDSVLKIIKLLIEERETILNYATRVMHSDFNVELLVVEMNNTAAGNKSDEAGHYYGGKSKNENIPWYLEGDEEYDLLLDINRNIKGGTKEALVAHLTHHQEFDSSFNNAFLISFATIMPIGELLHLLINRFNIDAPEGLSYEEFLTWRTQKQAKIRLKVLNVMRLLLENHWSNSYYNKSVLQRWLSFLKLQDFVSFPICEILVADVESILGGKILTKEEPVITNGKAPAPLLKNFSLRKLKLLDIEYIELARQLTIREFALYSNISKLSCIHKVWGKKSGLTESFSSITSFIKASNQLTNFVAYMILRKAEPRKRVQIIRYFVHVADKCRQYNNFSSMTAIISALYSSPIHRLKRTWSYVSKDTLTQLQSMNKLMNSSRNFNEYRDMLKFIGSEPCVPFFGVYLSDLTFIYHGNPDYLLNRNRMVNFVKRAKTVEIVKGIDRFKRIGYNFQTVNEIQTYLDLWFDKCPTIEEQYQLSLNLEPRVQSDRKQSKVAPATKPQPQLQLQTHSTSVLRYKQPMNVLGLR